MLHKVCLSILLGVSISMASCSGITQALGLGSSEPEVAGPVTTELDMAGSVPSADDSGLSSININGQAQASAGVQNSAASKGMIPLHTANYVDARELKLKMRELAAQLVAGLDESYASYMALPTVFVMQDDFERTSSFGRFVSEQMLYEFNQRGLSTREYRISGSLRMSPEGEFILARGNGRYKLNPNTLYLVGTYYFDDYSVFVNARLIKSDGSLVRSGQLILKNNPLTRRMLASSGKKIPEGKLGVLDFNTQARPPKIVSPIDQGMDIH